MKQIPCGKVITVNKIRDYLAKIGEADFIEPITAGIFISIAAWASEQHTEDKTPYWRTLRTKSELNSKYLGWYYGAKRKVGSKGTYYSSKRQEKYSI